MKEKQSWLKIQQSHLPGGWDNKMLITQFFSSVCLIQTLKLQLVFASSLQHNKNTKGIIQKIKTEKVCPHEGGRGALLFSPL